MKPPNFFSKTDSPLSIRSPIAPIYLDMLALAPWNTFWQTRVDFSISRLLDFLTSRLLDFSTSRLLVYDRTTSYVTQVAALASLCFLRG